MNSLSIRLRPQQLLDRRQYPPPHRPAFQVASLEHGVNTHAGLDKGVSAVLVAEDAGGAVDVEVGNHAGAIAFIAPIVPHRNNT